MDTLAVLPDDALAGVLGRLPPRSLAAARCVCRSWRDLVDRRRLLLPELLPHAVGGLFVSFLDHETPHFFARPSPELGGRRRRIDGEFAFVDARRRPKPYHWHEVVDHCNGLVLFSCNSLYLCNPATRWWARLPPCPGGRCWGRQHWSRRALVVYDPAVSPHWEVLMAPLDPDKQKKRDEMASSEEEEHCEILTEEEDGHGEIVSSSEEEHGEILSEEEEEGHGEISWEMMGWPPEEEAEDGHGEILLEEDGHGEILLEEDGHGEILPEEDGHGEISVDAGAWRMMECPPEEEEDGHCEMSEDDGPWRKMEWPPATWTWHVISSRTMRWEEKVFVREGDAAGTVAGLLLHSSHDCFEPLWHSSAYCGGEVYIHCRGEYVSRLSMSTNKYQVIKSPIGLAEHEEDRIGLQTIIGSSKNRLYFAAADCRARLRVWILNESRDEMEWELKHQSVVNIPFRPHREYDGPFWILDDFYKSREGKKILKGEGWNSDDDNVIDIEDNSGDHGWTGQVSFLGFHPYKEVIFIYSSDAVACHLNSTKMQYLGRLDPNSYNRGFYESVVYTPCLMEV